MKDHTNKKKITDRTALRRAFVLLAAVFTAITVAVACVLCLDVSDPVDINGVGQDGVSASANKSLTSAGTYDYTPAGAINNNDTISMAYCNGYYTIKLPQGTYKLEVWGGQGGGKSTTVYGGYGGYTYGQMVFSSTTTVYVYPGGAGGYGSSARTRAFNGGGAVTAGHPGGGGGGASHIATAPGTLSALGVGNNNILLVAGGGGGVGCNCASTTAQPGKGGGGHASGTSAPSGHHYNNRGGGYCGTVSSGGRGGAGNGANSGTFGLGGNQTTSNSTTGGGAGGGGYYGGGSGGADYPSYRDNDDGPGGGGSGFVNKNRVKSGTYGGTTGAWGAASATAYAGKAVITAVNVNQPPKTKNATISLFARGAGSKAINASDIATDPEGTSLYFTNGTASNLDTFTTTANTGLYFNSACTSLATKYFDWSWTSTSQLKITNVKLYPRSGVDGSTANGTIKLYARVRDSYGSNTQRGWAVIPFTVSVPVNSVSPRATTTPITVSGGGAYSYILGNSNTATAPEVNATPQTLYNPLGSGRYTAILSNSLRLGTSFTIKASDLIGNKYANDKAIIALNSTTAVTGSSRKFRIKEYDGNTNKVTAYNSNKVLISNTFDQISIECLKPDPGYQVFSLTLYIVEPNTAYGSSYPNVVAGCSTIGIDVVFKMDNTRPVLKDTSSAVPSVTLNCMQSTTVNLNTFYKDADTPNGLSASTHQIKNVIVAEREYIQLDKYGNVVSTVNTSGSNAKKSYFNIVPGSTGLSTAMTSDSLTTGMLNGSEYATGFESWYISNGASNTAFVQYGINNNNLTLNLTGLRATHSMYKQTRTASATRIATGGSVSNGISVGAGGAQGGLNAGHFYILINILDKNDSADTGIWLPLGVTVNNGAPTDMSRERNGAGASVMPTASGRQSDPFYFTPMGITVDRVTYPVGLRMADGELTPSGLQPLAADPDNFFTANMLNGSSIGSGGDNGILNELITLTSSATEVQGTVNGNSGGEYFTVSEEPIYIPLAYFGGRVQSSIGTVTTVGSTQYVKIRGLKVTLNGWTHNRYLYATVGLKDSANASVSANIAINVSNSAPTSITDTSKVAKINYSANGMTVGSSYTPASGSSVATVTYNIPMHSSVVVTPYDLLVDADMRATYPVNGFTLNGLSGLFDNSTRTFNVGATRTENDGRKVVKGLGNNYNTQNGGVDYSSDSYVNSLKQTLTGLQGTRSFDKLSTGNLFGSAQESVKSTHVDGLFFERTSDGSTLDGYLFDPYGSGSINSFATPSVIGDAFVSHTFGSSLTFNDNSKYYLDYIIITANSRTQVGAPAEILLNVRDRMGAGASGVSSGITTIKIVINVVNSSPRVQHPDKVYTLTTDPTDGSSWDVEDASAPITVKPSTFVINAYSYTQDGELDKNFLIDNEGDTVMFYTSGAVTVTDDRGNSSDGYKNSYLGKYLSVSITSTQLTITALNSTQSIPKLYVNFWVTDGRYSGNTLETYRCKIQVEVLNASLKANYDEDGFESTTFGEGTDATPLNLWTVETLDTSDVIKTRYFASSDAAVSALKGGDTKASNDQIKKLVDDTDALQGAILSPVRSYDNNIDALRGYYNADVTAETIDYKSMVPTIATIGSEGNPVAVIIKLLQSEDGSAELSKYFADGNINEAIDILYFIDGVAYSSKQLRSPSDTTVQSHPEKFFDDRGRWIVKDWAVSVKPNQATSANEYIQLNIMMRDETKFGGGSAGIRTGYAANESVAVDGFKYISYQLAINSLGIIPYTYYDQFDGYYTVRDGADPAVNYVSTYDGEVNSQYKGEQNIQSLYLSADNKIVTSGASDILKSRTTSGIDNTAAGVHSGFVYGTSAEYSYDVSANGQTIVGGEKAFKYSDTIVVESSGSTYIPMSYFALRRGLVSPDGNGKIEYPVNHYVSYDVSGSYNRGSLAAFAGAISISDGINTWTGADQTNSYNIYNNPYVNISAYDAFVGTALQETDAYLGARNGNYFNKNLAVTSVGSDGKALGYLSGTGRTENSKHLVGNGHVMYLTDQQTKLQENMFGIELSKKSTRASASSLTITIAVADCEYQNGNTKVVDPTNTSASAKVTYKLDIGNSPIELVNDPATSNVAYDANKGYYTTVELDTASDAWDLELLRSDVRSETPVKRVIRYTDGDVVKDTANNVDETKSDKAYFFADSLNELGSWIDGHGAMYYNRAKSYNASAAELTFDNTANAEYAQKSMRNYFGKRNVDNHNFNPATINTIGDVDSDFQPNDGIYGSNINGESGKEGFSRYFNVTVSGDGSTLSIMPISKTTINAGMHGSTASDRNKYYNKRGLEYDANRSKGYYPLKVLIYDSHGDGFMYGSYVALEIRIYIDGAAPTLSPNLVDDDSPSAKKGDKKIDVAMPVGQSYQYSVSDVIRSNSLLANDNGNIFWAGDYADLKNSSNKTLEDMFKLDMGTYLQSPFSDTNYGWRSTGNAELRAGSAKLSDGKVAASSQPDVIMFMEYTGDRLSAASSPIGNTINISVNRRTTYDRQQYKKFTFKILFTDSDGHSTATLSINVEVTNQAPTVRSKAVENAQNIRMRVGDSFTVVTTPYDKFVGTADNNSNIVSAQASTSYKRMMNEPAKISQRNLLKISGDTNYRTSVRYSELTTDNVDKSDKYKLHSYDPDNVAAQHLGYLAIADDDTPWALRIHDIKYYDSACFRVASKYDMMPLEGKETGDLYALDTVIVANRVCTDMPVTITVIDEENAMVSLTIYVTVESSKPSPIPNGDRVHNRHEGLLTTYDSDNNEQLGVYETYMTAMTDSTAHLRNVSVADANTSGGLRVVRNVYGELELTVNQLAYDPDENDNDRIALYSENDDYDIFMFNGMPMERTEHDKLTYFNDMFRINVASDYRSFKITCLTYDPYRDWDELKFYVRDVGNNIFDNSIGITIRISTLNSALTNEHQSAVGKVTNGIINANTVDTVYVKPFDDYTGASADVKDLPAEQKNEIIGVSGTYQFLNYKDAPQSIDQPSTAGWGINDSDVVNNVYNRNYDVRVYALMEVDENDNRKYNPLTINQASALFDLAPSQLQSHYWSLKSDANVSEYFVGGVRAGGGTISGVNSALNMFLQQYFVFGIGEDGVSLTFRPVTSNIDLNILFYVEVHKDVTSRSITRAGASTDAGTIFYVKVKDSAPIANTEDSELLEFSGKVGDSSVFTIYDESNPYGSLFIDSDMSDMVSIGAFTSASNAEADYNAALAEADCDWQARQGVKRAIDIAVNNSDEAVNGVPAHSLKVTIQRRIDVVDENGKYATEVTLPILLTGADKAGRTVVTRIHVTIQNSDVSFNENKLAESPRKFDAIGVGYEFSKDAASGMYIFDAYVAPDSDSLSLNLVLDEWLVDPDFTSMSADVDSYRLVKPMDGENAHKYMYNSELDICPEDSTDAIASISPIFGNNGANVDPNHFAGFTVRANSYERGVTGVAYMRIIDRSADELESEGVTIKVKVTVLNAAPNVKLGMDKKSYVIIGSDAKESDPVTINISEFVEDRNNDRVRIFSMAAIEATEVHCSVDEENGGDLLRVDSIDGTDEKFNVVARKGFYGKQAVLVTVADGDFAVDLSARTTTFTIEFTVIYDFNQVSDLNTVTAVRSLPFKVTPQVLFANIVDTFDADYNGEKNSSGSHRVLASADGEKTFNPGNDYVITDLVANTSGVTVDRDEDGDWRFVSTREIDGITFDVTFVRKVDADNADAQVFKKQFIANVGKNHSPVLIEQIRRNNEFTFHTREGEYGLDANGNVTLTTDMLFGDVDLELGDKLTFDASVTSVVSSTMCTVRVSDDGLMLYITFNMRGETDLTVGIKDRTGETVKATFKIKNIDRPSPSFMDTVKISYESHPYIWLGVAAGVLALILFIILLIILLKRRKRKQEELEAILVSEMELEEQMMRLSGGIGSAPYQSFGYLPPTMPVQNDPGLMIGGGDNTPKTDVIGLNPGSDQNDNTDGGLNM